MPTHVITGSGSGIGAAVAQRLSERGDRLILVARSDERAQELVDRFPGSDAIVADLGDPDALEAAGEKICPK